MGEKTWVNPSNPRPKSWDYNNLYKTTQKQITKLDSQSIQYQMIELRIKKSIERREKLESIELTHQTCGWGHKLGKSNKK